jgi:hypothetical protein
MVEEWIKIMKAFDTLFLLLDYNITCIIFSLGELLGYNLTWLLQGQVFRGTL